MSGARPKNVKLPAVQISPEELAGVNLTDDDVRRLRGLQARLSAGEMTVKELSEGVVEDLLVSTSSPLPAVTEPLPAVVLTEADRLRLQAFQQRITAQGIPATRASSASRSSPLPRSAQAPANRLALTAASTADGPPNRHFSARGQFQLDELPHPNALITSHNAHRIRLHHRSRTSRLSQQCRLPRPRTNHPLLLPIPKHRPSQPSQPTSQQPCCPLQEIAKHPHPQSRQQIQLLTQEEAAETRRA